MDDSAQARAAFAVNREPLSDLEARFWSKVRIGDDCWEWTAYRLRGYGLFHVRSGVKWKTMRANRIAWELVCGPIPDGLHACHRCDNPACVRPSHLFLGTHAENVRDMDRKGRRVTRLPEHRCRGANQGRAKLDDDRVRAMRELRTQGWKLGALAERFGVNVSNVSLIVNRKTWRHI